MFDYPISHDLHLMNMAIQSNMAERFEELDVDYMRGFIDYYYTQEVGKIKGFILKHELGLWPPIIVGAMSKQIKEKELFERKNSYEWMPYKDGFKDSFIVFNQDLAKKLNITKQDRLTFARLSELVAQPVLKEDAFYKYINYHIKPSKEDYELDYSHGKI